MKTVAIAAWWFLALFLSLISAVYACSEAHDDDEDEVEQWDDDDSFDFFSNNLDLFERNDLIEVKCNSMDCSSMISKTNGRVPYAWDRGLVTPKIKPALILHEHARAASNMRKNFRGETLVYVTPWNKRGYELAKQFRTKFTYISPVWLQVREDSEKVPIITGTHEIDRQWVHDIRNGDEEIEEKQEVPAIVPRVVYERNRLSSEDVPLIIDNMLELMNKHTFDGMVFEVPVIGGTVDMLQQMARAFQEVNKLLILVLSRSSKDGEMSVTHEIFAELAPLVHRFSMNAYDFATPGPNAPYWWLEKTLRKMSPMERQRILMGVPFYGYDNTDAITGSMYIQSLRDNNITNIRWDATAHECQHEYTAARTESHHVVYFPCLQFLHDRLTLYKDHGVGVAIWELGQELYIEIVKMLRLYSRTKNCPQYRGLDGSVGVWPTSPLRLPSTKSLSTCRTSASESTAKEKA
ncbi:hypothetical protein PsorP6_004843 [Peronosclerospora sorghi]|uniref:Uncharacterized protein n=1 Tax=Peronosclerospora sorghi TaxID=230839 RepID=A0ACC0W1F3_9STRA|nr:hypothetical protein PsorP6_004843 [Peronosclerospora sorghi]